MNSIPPHFRGCLTWTAFSFLSFLSLSVVGQNIPPPAEDDTTLALIKAGSAWRYFDQGGEVGAGWRSLTFHDAAWATGPAQLGYGDGDEATVVGSGPDAAQRRITTYFRRVFELPGAGNVTQLRLRLLRDDGAVVYLNGQEVVRDNMPAGLISADTLAASAAGADENQFHEFVLGPTFLVDGRNVVAVEVHQVNAASTDLSFDLELSAVSGTGPSLPVVSIEATAPETTEPSPTTRVIPGAFTITRHGDASETLVLFLEFGGTATFGQDYEEVSRFVSMPAGATSVKVLVAAVDDAAAEGDETVIATVSANPPINSLPNYRVDPERNHAAVVIHDSDVAPALAVVGIAATGWRTGEPCPVCFVAPGMFTISRTGATTEALKVYLEYDGPATAGQDYPDLPHQVTIPAGQKSTDLLLMAFDDHLVEGPEIVRARIVSPELATLGYVVSPSASEAMVVIGDDEAGAPAIRLDLAEPDEGAQVAMGTTIQLSALGVWTQGELDQPVRFFAGDTFIGQSNPPQLDRLPIPGLPSVHTVLWANPPPGKHVLTARFEALPGAAVISPPVNVTVGPGLAGALLSIEATQTIAEESSFPLRRIALRGEFTISRTGPTNDPLSVFVHVSGLAMPEADYPSLPMLVTIPAGAHSTLLEVVPIPDNLPEGIETLVATLSDCPPATNPPLGIPCRGGFEIDQTRSQATVFLRDDGITQASLTITNPKDGASVTLADPILIEAVAIDLESYLSRVEFMDGEKKIGESEIVFIRAPDPGTPIYHSFEWEGAAPGSHSLTARVIAADGTVLTSQPVQITVGVAGDRVVLEIEATDPVAAESGENGAANAAADVAVFTVRRVSGPRHVEVSVFYAVTGTAQNGIDYAALSGHTLLPSGAESMQLIVRPIPDKALEGDETVIVRLDPPICILIFPQPPECYAIGSKAEAKAIITEHSANQAPIVAITHPEGGSGLPAETPIEIVATTTDPDGHVRRVEFFAEGRKLGEASMDFIRAPDPGQSQTFTFVWHQPTPGPHTLTARALDDAGAAATSAPIGIKVGLSESLPSVTVDVPDSFAVEPRANIDPNTATFRIQRFGSSGEALMVAYSLGGTAQNGIDYGGLPGLATIPAGQRSVDVVVRPLADAVSESVETVVLQLESPPAPTPGGPVTPAYRVGQPHAAAAVISDGPWVPAPGAAQCLPLPGNMLHLCFAAETGRNYRVEASPDLRNWETLTDAVSSDGAWHFVDTEMQNHPFRFYRLAPEPVVDPGG